MTHQDLGTELDIDAILAARWADPRVFPPSTFADAEAFWLQLRTHDADMLAIRAKAMSLVFEWSGRSSRDVGSFGLRLNLQTSDLDLGIGYPMHRRAELIEALAPHTVFKGERVTRFPTAASLAGPSTSTRLVFAFNVAGVEVDLSALTEEDFTVACRMIDQIELTMSDPECIAHTWIKHRLYACGRLTEYAEWKLVTYARFCPEFAWIPIPQTI